MSKYSKLSERFSNEKLKNKEGKTISLDEGLGDDCEYVAIYFSAHVSISKFSFPMYFLQSTNYGELPRR